MQSKSIWQYIYFGMTLYYLQRAQRIYPIYRHLGVVDNINRFIEGLGEFRLLVTLRAAQPLQEFRDELIGRVIDESLEKEEVCLTAADAKRLAELVTDIRKTLEAESEGNIAFIVAEKRLDVNKLLLDIRSLMAPGVYDSLSDIAQYDFKEAGRCIAFELPTSAGFHLMRGTEGVLRSFYCSIVKRNRMNVLLWGPMVTALRNRRVPPEEGLLDNLDNIRKSFRNPTQHPEKIYDIQEVQDLFGLSIEVVNRMVHAMKGA